MDLELAKKLSQPANTKIVLCVLDGLGGLAQHATLRSELENLWAQNNQATDGTTAVDAEYLEVIATR